MLRFWVGRSFNTLVVAIVTVVGLLGIAGPAVAANSKGTLAVVVVGPGSVSSEPPGIACPGKCIASFPAGTSVALEPKPSKGSALLHWGGSCSGSGLCKVQVTTLVSVAAQFSSPSKGVSSGTGSAGQGLLTSGVPVRGDVRSAAGVTFKFDAVAGHHVTLAITSPHLAPPGGSLQVQVYNRSRATDVNGVTFSTGPTEIDFTPTATQAGLTTVVISPYNGQGTTGSFDLTYAKDVTGKLKSGVPVAGTITWEGQDADYTFEAVAGQHVALAITNPHLSPSGDSMQVQVYDSSGATDVNGVTFSTGPTEVDFTPTATQAGLTSVVISQYNGQGTTGKFDLTYAKDVTGELKPGVPVTGTIAWAGQDAGYTFTAVAGAPVTLAITNPHLSPSGDSMQVQVYDSSGASDANGAAFSTSPTEIQFTPTAAQAGPTTVVISQYNGQGTTGSFTLTYTG